MTDRNYLYPADILLPESADMTCWACVACDQYTSEPEYWARADKLVGAAPSALRLILPEVYLEQEGVDIRITEINRTMQRYTDDGLFRTLPGAMLYVERTLRSGSVRRGLVAAVDLEDYDFTQGSESPIRATEGTVLSRIPPRAAVRRNALLELPHIMLLIDDRDDRLFSALAAARDEMERVYDFPLMQNSGSVCGHLLSAAQQTFVQECLRTLADPAAFAEKYALHDKPVLLFAVGDGNHSLATAKAVYEERKAAGLPAEDARYALVELVNLHDASLEFEPIHRVLFHVDPAQALASFFAAFPGAHEGPGEGHTVSWVSAEGGGEITVPTPEVQLEVGTLQSWIDTYLQQHPEASVDYVHGDDVVRALAAEPDRLGFLLPAMDKNSLFKTVICDGALPRKTFSMGEACDKRFYIEARRIR